MHPILTLATNKIKQISKRIYFAFWWRYQNLKTKIVKNAADSNVVFTFGGRNDSWPTLGKDLYKKDDYFNDAIKTCNKILIELGGEEILSYFENEDNSNFFSNEVKFTCIAAIQISITKIYKDHSIYPNAVLGVSLGEPAAAYAAGAISMKDSLKISLSYLRMLNQNLDFKNYSFLLLHQGITDAIQTCQYSPVWTEVVFENSSVAVLVTCHKDDQKNLLDFFALSSLRYSIVSEKTSYPYHSSLIKSHYKNLKNIFNDIDFKPLRCDYYSPTLGHKINKYELLDAHYWAILPTVPVLLGSALSSIANNGLKNFLQLGPPAISSKHYGSSLGTDINIQNSFDSQYEEHRHHLSIIEQFNKAKPKQSEFQLTDDEFLQYFKNNLDVYYTANYESFEYLRKRGNIHFLPKNGAWLMLNYEDIDYALKETSIFSSSINSEYDPILLGAKPDDHKVVRDLLYPLFSPQIINELSEFTLLAAESLLENLLTKSEFDFVTDYSDPLSFLVLCNFFGLSTTDANRLINITGKDYHNQSYWQKLEGFFETEFMTCHLTKNDCLWSKLRNLTQAEMFPLENSVSLLKIVWTAGLATTSALISSSIYNLLINNEITDQLQNDQKLISKFIEECLRLHPPLEGVYRVVEKEVLIGSSLLNKNARVLLHLKSGMVDPNHYENANTFSISRPAKKHLAFGAGIHQCIGMGIARAEARSALSVVLNKFSDIKFFANSEPKYVFSDLKAISSLKMKKNNK